VLRAPGSRKDPLPQLYQGGENNLSCSQQVIPNSETIFSYTELHSQEQPAPTLNQPPAHQHTRCNFYDRTTNTLTEMGDSTSANPGSPCCTTSRKTDSHQYNTVIPLAQHSFIPPPPPLPVVHPPAPPGHSPPYWPCHFLATSLPSINIQTHLNPSYSSFTCLGRWNR
jgi:hypothetical protein